ncbi:hypothetical protein C8F01DRAFT_1291063 [Mycena amicta]|nr:hypothetical protein C8F01DRAFT_1291063 [Mycena amicta]
MSELPPELLENIAGFIPDKSTLYSLAQTGSRLLAPSQRALFKQLDLVYTNAVRDGTPIGVMDSILSSSPHLAAYVHELTIVLVGDNDDTDHLALMSVLSRVQRLNYLVLSARTGNGLARSLIHPLPESVMSQLSDTFALPSLGRLCVHCMGNAPLALIVAAMSVPHLSLKTVRMDLTPSLLPDPVSPLSPRLQALTVWDSFHLDRLFEFFDSSPGREYSRRIRALEVQIYRHYLSVLDRLIALCAGHLERLTFRLHRAFTIQNTLPCLRQLELILFMDSNGTFPPNLDLTLSNFASSTPLLTTLTLRCQPRTLGLKHLWRNPDPADMPWQLFGTDFSQRLPHLLRHLQRVECILSLRRAACKKRSAEKVFDAFVAVIEARMPGLKVHGENPLLVCSMVEPLL